MIRAFLAIDLSPEILGLYARAYAAGRSRKPRVRWVRPENVHITLRFLGDVSEDRLQGLRSRIAEVTGRTSAFRASMGRAGCFGPRGAPQVLWFSVESSFARGAPLQALAAAVEDAVSSFGLEAKRRPWTAHATVARNPDRVGWEGWEGDLESWGLGGIGFDVREVVLYSSTLRPQGPSYSRVWSLPLGEISPSEGPSEAGGEVAVGEVKS